MASYTRTACTTPNEVHQLQQKALQRRTLLSGHPGFLELDPHSLSAPISAPSGVSHFATAQPEETIQLPISNAPSTASRVALGAVAGGLEGGADAHLQMGLAKQANAKSPLEQCMQIISGGASILSLF